MSDFYNFQFPIYNMGGVREDIVAPMPTARVIGKWAGTPEGVALLKQCGPEITHHVTALRQHYYTGILPMVRKFIDTPNYRMEYVMHEGKELITIQPLVSTTRRAEPSGPCRFILIEHSYAYNTVQLYQMSPPFDVLGGATVVSEIDGHRLFSRHEVLSGKLKEKFVGTGYGTQLVGSPVPQPVPSWQDFRSTPEGYPNVYPTNYDEGEEWPPFWRHWRVNPGPSTLPTKASRRARVPQYSNLPSVLGDPAGVFDAQENANVITIIDIEKYAEVVADVVRLQCSGFWQTLIVTNNAAVDFFFAITEFRQTFASNFVRFPTPAPVQTAITRVWLSGEEEFTALGSDTDRLLKLLDEAPYIDDAFESSTEYQRSLGISLATTAFTRTVAATQSDRVEPTPFGPFTKWGSPPTVLPWGDTFGTLTYNCRTGEWGFDAPESEPVDLS